MAYSLGRVTLEVGIQCSACRGTGYAHEFAYYGGYRSCFKCNGRGSTKHPISLETLREALHTGLIGEEDLT